MILGDLLEENYNIDPAAQDAVTLQTSHPLTRDELIPTLELLSDMNGAALVSQNGLYNVMPAENATGGTLAPPLGNSSAPLPRGFREQVVPLSFMAGEEMQRAEMILAARGAGRRRLLGTVERATHRFTRFGEGDRRTGASESCTATRRWPAGQLDTPQPRLRHGRIFSNSLPASAIDFDRFKNPRDIPR